MPNQYTGFNLIVQHYEVSPFSRKKNSFVWKHLANSDGTCRGLIYQALSQWRYLSCCKIPIALTTPESARHLLVGNPEGTLLKLALVRVTTRIVLREKKL